MRRESRLPAAEDHRPWQQAHNTLAARDSSAVAMPSDACSRHEPSILQRTIRLAAAGRGETGQRTTRNGPPPDHRARPATRRHDWACRWQLSPSHALSSPVPAAVQSTRRFYRGVVGWLPGSGVGGGPGRIANHNWRTCVLPITASRALPAKGPGPRPLGVAVTAMGLAGRDDRPRVVAAPAAGPGTGACLAGHIALDRLQGYGLKYDNSFQHTHLGMLGKRREAS